MAADAFPPSADLSVSSDDGGDNNNRGVRMNPALDEHDEDEFQRGRAPLKYVPLSDVYSATAPCVTASGSKKVKKAAARKPPQINGRDQLNSSSKGVMAVYDHVYTRRRKRKNEISSFWEGLCLKGLDVKSDELEVDGGVEIGIKRRRGGIHTESVKLGVDCKSSSKLDEELGVDCKSSSKLDDQMPSLDSDDKINSSNVRKNRSFNSTLINGESRKRKNDCSETDVKSSGGGRTKKWVWLSFEGADPKKFIGLQCKVYWPLDARWYSGHIVGYKSETERHQVKYEDGEEEELNLSNERIKFHVSLKEMQDLKLKFLDKSSEVDGIDVNEMMVLAASLDDCPEIETGDVIWAKLAENPPLPNKLSSLETLDLCQSSLCYFLNGIPPLPYLGVGHAVWPAIVLDESHVSERKGLNKISGEKSVIVQFFGTHDFARVARKHVISFLKGLLASCHSKCKKPTFIQGLEEAKMYLSEQKLPKSMLQLRDGVDADMNDGGDEDHEDGADSGDEESMNQDEINKKIEDLKSCPLEEGELQIISLGKIVKDSGNFQNERFIWPEGYTAVRMFPSIKDPSLLTLYKMEVLRDIDSRTRPLFRVTCDSGEEFNGPTPSVCWNKIYKKIKTVQIRNRDYKDDQSFAAGSDMFGFSHPKVSKLIKEMSCSRKSSKAQSTSKKDQKPTCDTLVHVEWRDLDKCNVCHMDEEYETNLFLQCDKCRMMVHAKCYGELEPTGGNLWLCNLCRPGAPEPPPRCCLCPVVGGAMKPTTDERWAHLACAIWIPETCLSDVKKMEPIDGVCRVNKDRWKLTCSICHIPHGACIQCSNNNCYVAYHPLCARAAGFCLEPEDMDRLHVAPSDEDEEDQCIQLLSFCRKHRPSSNEHLLFEERIAQKASEKAEYIPPINPSGCARTQPYDFSNRRGRNAPEVPAASSKRLYVENQPYLIGGCSPRMPLWNKMSSDEPGGSKFSGHLLKLQKSNLDPSGSILSVADKYNYMKNTFKKRLAFGKSGIHGYGVFTKFPHRAGDMVIEYTGELIRATVADRREHKIYNSLVGAGTYMFRIDDERVIDATRAGSIAHLINHSCEPNCYSRVISVNGVDHIIIFAKRDIKQWEELTYDYRFLSIDERLACNCGSSRCRGVVNDVDAEERVAKLYVPRSELKDWKGE